MRRCSSNSDLIVDRKFCRRPSIARMVHGMLVAVGCLLAAIGCDSTTRRPASQNGAADPNDEPPPDTPQFAIPQSEESTVATEDQPQIVKGNTFEDFDYAFRIDRPSTDWQFLNEERSHSLSNDAAMAMINTRQKAYVVVIAERMEQIDLTGYVDLILSNSPLGRSQSLRRETAEVGGYTAQLVTSTTAIEGIHFTYRMAFFQRGAFFYQVMTWALAEQFDAVEGSLNSIIQSMRFIEDRQPRVRSATISIAETSVTWKIADGVYQNAAFGFQLTPSGSFRLAGQSEMINMGPEAAAGIVSSEPAFYQLIMAENAGDVDHADFAEAATRRFEQSLEVNDARPESTQVVIAGIEAEQKIYRNVSVSGADFDFAHTYFFRNSNYFRLQSWWASADAADAEPALRKSYALLGWLDETQRHRLVEELIAADMNNSVGPAYCLRNRMFRDFEFGFTLRLPRGLWEAATGDAAAARNPAARLLITEATTGVSAVVIPEMLELSHEDYHKLLRQNMDVPADPPAEEIAHGDIGLLKSVFSQTEFGVAYDFRMVTAKRGNRAVQILVSALSSNQQELDDATSALIDGFAMTAAIPDAVVKSSNKITDHRLGFRLTSPGGWKLAETPIPQIQSISSMLVMSRDDAACLGLGICSPQKFEGDFAVDAMARSSSILIDPGSRRETKSTLAGLPARKVVMSGTQQGKPAFLKVWMAQRGHSMYAFLVMGQQGTDAERKSDDFPKYFSLVQ